MRCALEGAWLEVVVVARGRHNGDSNAMWEREAIMARTIEELEAIARERICRICTDRTADGQCGLKDPSACALFHFFPRVAHAVQTVHSEDIRDYIAAIRAHVCAGCPEQDADGTCELRNQVRCALDAYLIPVIEVIEESTGRSFDRNLIVKEPTAQQWCV
jgi:hypothetical protein